MTASGFDAVYNRVEPVHRALRRPAFLRDGRWWRTEGERVVSVDAPLYLGELRFEFEEVTRGDNVVQVMPAPEGFRVTRGDKGHPLPVYAFGLRANGELVPLVCGEIWLEPPGEHDNYSLWPPGMDPDTDDPA